MSPNASIIPIQHLTSKPKDQSDALDRLRQHVKTDIVRINALIAGRSLGKTAIIGQVTNHILDGGGKRLRPMLTLATARLCGYRGQAHIALAACVECLHTATLLHDDVIDESLLRRGLKTSHTLWGNRTSILVGDFLLSQAFTLMLDSQSLSILRVLAETAATIAEGEIKQSQLLGHVAMTETDYLDIIQAKTAHLFAASCQVSAMLDGEDHKDLSAALYSYGLNLGIAYQLIDDVLDYHGGNQTWGKGQGTDFHEGKVTLPVILAYGRGNADERAFWQRCFKNNDRRIGDKKKALALIKSSGSYQDTVARAKHYGTIACDALAVFKPSALRQTLIDTIDFNIHRKH